MEFFAFLKRESQEFDSRLLGSAAFAGVLNTLLIFVLTGAAGRAAANQSLAGNLILATLCLAAFWLSKSFLLRKTTEIVEGIIEKIRLRIAEKVRRTDLAALEAVGTAPIFNAISTQAADISRGCTGIVSGASSLVLLICALCVVYFISSTACLLLVGALAFMIGLFLADRNKILSRMAAVSAQENEVTRDFNDLLHGFKEIKMNSARNREFFAERIRPATVAAREMRVSTGMAINQSVLLGSSSLFILLAVVVFLLPVLSPADAPKLVRITTIIVFIFGPLSEVIGVYPYFTQAVAAIGVIDRLEARLDELSTSAQMEPLRESVPPLKFESIRCEGLAFHYPGGNGDFKFSLSPLNFELSRGEIVFITGGNGSGKSTFLKVLAGLYPPAAGTIFLNDSPVGPENRQAYRDIFGAIFADCHLFDQAYGVPNLDPERVRHLLHRTGLLEKTGIEGRRITNLQLSSGQRKRLALVMSLLEEKDVYLFDEWAAEQDPVFRREFYRRILPSLKEQGKTIVAITHDEDYYNAADRVLKMQYGNFVPFHPES